EERRDDLAAQAELGEELVLGELLLLEVLAHDDVAAAHTLEHGAAHRPRASGREELGRTAARGRDRLRGVVLDEDDRGTVERNDGAELADERAEGRLDLERRAERTRAAVRGIEDLAALPELVAQPLSLGGA